MCTSQDISDQLTQKEHDGLHKYEKQFKDGSNKKISPCGEMSAKKPQELSR